MRRTTIVFAPFAALVLMIGEAPAAQDGTIGLADVSQQGTGQAGPGPGGVAGGVYVLNPIESKALYR